MLFTKWQIQVENKTLPTFQFGLKHPRFHLSFRNGVLLQNHKPAASMTTASAANLRQCFLLTILMACDPSRSRILHRPDNDVTFSPRKL